MQKFMWDSSLATGVPMIDTQHKELIIAFNDLSEAIEDGQGSSVIKKFLTFLKYYSEWHFEHEEKCAARHHCAIAGTNKAAHERFLQIVSELQTQYRESGDSEAIARQAHEELSSWLVSHILKIDTQIGQCVRACTTA